MKVNKMSVVMMLIVLVPGLLVAQQDRGTIRGTVVDPSAAVVGGAVVTAVNTATGVRTTTSSTSEGNYNIPNLQAGPYRVEVEAASFKKLIRDNVRVNSGVVVALDLQLSIGETSESVTVTAEAPQLEKESSDIRTTINPDTFADLPLVSGTGRNPTTFALLSPGTRQGGNSAAGSFYTTFNGGQILSGEVELDGLSVVFPPSPGQPDAIVSMAPEAIQEVSIITSSASADTRGGSGVTRYTIRSGTNQFHGNLYEFLRNDKLDANSFFRNRAGLDRAPARRNEFGGSVGGPIWIPKVWKGTDRTFFFTDIQGFRLRQTPAAVTVTVAPLAFRQGDFSSLKDAQGKQVILYDPLTTRDDGKGGLRRDPFPGNIIPANRISRVAKNVLPYWPNPNLPGNFNNFLGSSPAPTDLNSWTFKLDHRFTKNHGLSFSWTYFDRLGIAGSILGMPDGLRADTFQGLEHGTARLAHDWMIKPNLINHAIIGYNRRNRSVRYRGARDDRMAEIGLSSGFINEGIKCGPGFTFGNNIYGTGYEHLNGGQDPAELDTVDNYPLTDSLSWVKGQHNLKFGGDIRWTRLNFGPGIAGCPGFGFSAGKTGFPNSVGLDPAIPRDQQAIISGDPFAAFLLGASDGAGKSRLSGYLSPRWSYYAGFVQDDFKLRPNFTLNLGLRYDFWTPIFDRSDTYSIMDPTVPNPGAAGLPGAIVFAGTGPGRVGYRRLTDGYDRNNFSPHLGFAWGVKPNLVVRAGAGMAYFMTAPYGTGNVRGYTAGFDTSVGVGSPNPWTPGFYLDDPWTLQPPLPTFAPTANLGQGAQMWDPRAVMNAFMQTWNLNIQYEFAKNWMVDLAYVGNKGNNLESGMVNPKQLDPKYLALGDLLLKPIDDPAVVALGFKPPFPGFIELYKPLLGGSSPSLRQALSPFPQYSGVTLGPNSGGVPSGSSPTGNSTYHSFQMKLTKQAAQGLFLLTSYTWSKKITDADSNWGGFNGTSARDTFNRQLEKAVSPSNPPHRLTTALTYELPFGPGKKFANGGGAVGKIVGGWQVNGIVTYQTGIPIQINYPNSLPINNFKNYPNMVLGQDPVLYKGGRFDPATDRYLNRAAFSVPADFTFGNAPSVLPNARDFALFNEDISISKRTKITETTNFELRCEMFNTFNRVRFSTPDFNLLSPGFGSVGGTALSPRVIQFALKFNF